MIVKLSVCLSLFLSSCYFSQGFTVASDFSMASRQYNAEILDQSHLKVIYKLDFVHNLKFPEKKSTAYCVLQIGENYAKFNDLNQKSRDSLEEVFSKKARIDSKDFGWYNRYTGHWKKDIVKDVKRKQFRLQQFTVKEYEASSSLPTFNWVLKDETLTIHGYICRKAETQYGGRHYTAWYAPDIPVSEGPYLFHGLPGLILKIEDSEQHYVFELYGLEKKEEPIYWRNEDFWLKTSLEDLRKLEKSYNENPGFYMSGGAYDENGKPLTLKLPPKPYNPIERN